MGKILHGRLAVVPWAQFTRFALVGGIGAVVDIGGTMILISAGWSPIGARIPAILAAVFVTWALHGLFTFVVPGGLTARNLGRFTPSALAIAVLNYLLYVGMVSVHLWPLAALVIAIGVCMCVSYVTYRFFVFRSRP